MDLSQEEYDLILNETQILQLINHRNKNQHRTLVWWRYFKMLLSQLKRIVILPVAKSITPLYTKKLVRKCFYEFYGVVKLAQFLSLGLVLVASLSRIDGILNRFKPQPLANSGQTTNVEPSQIQGSEDLGEILDPGELEVPKGKKKEKKERKEKKDKKDKKKRKQKSDIDKIFG